MHRTAIQELAIYSKRLAELCSSNSGSLINVAKASPNRRRQIIENTSIVAKNGHYPAHCEPTEAREMFALIREQLVATATAQGEAERDAELAAICAEIDAICGVICSYAAKATIEAGQVARSIRKAMS